MRRKLSIIVTVLMLAVAALIVGQGWAGAVDGGPVLHFMDSSRGTSFSTHADSADPNYGQFSFAVPGLGTYVGGSRDAAHTTPEGKGTVVINFKGDVQLIAQPGSSVPGGKRTVRLNAQAGPKPGNATAVLIDGNTTYQMVSHAPGAAPDAAVSAVASAMTARDWQALYNLTSSTFTGGKDVNAFATELTSQEAQVGKVVKVEVLSKPNVQFSPQGIWFFTVQTRVTFEKNGSQQSQTFNDYYLLEKDQWKFWLSEAA